MLLKVRLDEAIYNKLERVADVEHRPVSMQAEWFIQCAVLAVSNDNQDAQVLSSSQSGAGASA